MKGRAKAVSDTGRLQKALIVTIGALIAFACSAGGANLQHAYAADEGLAAGTAVLETQMVNNVYVNGVDIFDSGSVSCGDGYATYDKTTKTLTLSNAYIDADYGFQNIWIIGNDNDIVTIKLIGSNVINYCGSGFGTCIVSNPSLVFEGNGTLEMQSAWTGVSSDSNITIKSGKFSADVGDSGFKCDKMIMKGGKLASVAGGTYAVQANSMTNDPSQLGHINGRLPKDAVFKARGNLYKVNSSDGLATLTKYGSKKEGATVNTIKCGYKYKIDTVGAEAFANTKVATVTLGKNVKNVKKKAFYSTTELTKLIIRNYDSSFFDIISLDSKALTKAGKNSGKNLTVKVKTTKSVESVRTTLLNAGLSKRAKVKTF